MSHLEEGSLNALLDNELDDAERRAAEAHLAGCPECRRRLEEARAFAVEADHLVGLVEVPQGPAQKKRAGGRLPGGLPRWRSLAWAATVVLAAGFGWYASALRRPVEMDQVGKLARQAAPPAANDAEAGPAAATATAEAERKSEVAQPQAAPPAAPKDERETPERNEALRAQRRLDRNVTEPAPADAGSMGGIAVRDKPAAESTPSRPALVVRGNASVDSAAGRYAADTKAALSDSGQGPPAAPLAAAAPYAAKEVPAERAGARQAFAAEFRAVKMEDAVRTLSGSIRLVDGLTPLRFLSGPGNLLSGADPGRPVIRVVYEDPPGRELWLDQQRPVTEDDRLARAKARNLVAGDTVLTSHAGGSHGIAWIDQHGFRLALTGYLPGDSLRAIMARVH